MSNNDEILLDIVDQDGTRFHITTLYPVAQASVIQYKPRTSTFDHDSNFLSDTPKSIHIFKSSETLRPCLHLCKIDVDGDDTFEQFGVVFHFHGEYHGIFKVPGVVERANSEFYPMRSESDLVKVIVSDGAGVEVGGDDRACGFSMKPPKRTDTAVDPEPSPNSNSQSNSSLDPAKFLKSRYFNSLYALTEPLAYFSKTALTRFRNMCKDQIHVVEILHSLVMTIEEFDKRYAAGPAVLFHDSPRSVFEVRESEKLKKKIGVATQEDASKLAGPIAEQLQKVVLELKVREAQLQVLILLEYLKETGVDENEFLRENSKKEVKLIKKAQTRQRTALVRSKKQRGKRTSTSTRTRTEREDDSNGAKESSLDEEFNRFTYLNRLIDRLNLWEVLLTNKSGNNSRSFMAYVLIPYYHQKLPVLLKHIIDNMKTINMKLVSKKRNPSEFEEKKSDVASKNVSIERPVLKKKRDKQEDDSSIVEEISIRSIKRSKSNLGQSKDLNKRQVDLNIKPPPKEKSKIEDGVMHIFAQAKRSKSINVPPAKVISTPVKNRLQTLSFSQVEATPAGPRIEHADIYTPRDGDNSILLSSPDKFLKPRSPNQNRISERLRDASNDEVLVHATPQKAPPPPPPSKLISTPRSAIHSSSPVSNSNGRTVPKPGDPNPLAESPMYKACENADLFDLNQANDSGYDSDEILNPKKKIKPTYSRKK
ncbi:uncharacterized protein LODBEIA_P32090 [Lodderomyces beijingensis]|uniref:DNA replication regulator Sld3 C-terminal domain-containing protein n=1 Tax=Lodderomyces beijingensis TaxID=1775926 RepID=A0ABP0ZS00_9ASCO